MEVKLSSEALFQMLDMVASLKLSLAVKALVEIQKVALHEAGLPNGSALDNCQNTLAVIYALATEALEISNAKSSLPGTGCAGNQPQ